MKDLELQALGHIAEALEPLKEEQIRNVLLYVNSRYGGIGQAVAPRPPLEPVDPAPSSPDEFDEIDDLYDAADPETEADRVLVAAYWVQAIQGADNFASQPVNTHLKQLGHPVSNVTRALDSMIRSRPRLVMQVGKSGTAKQARKTYKITREGAKRVTAMLETTGGEA